MVGSSPAACSTCATSEVVVVLPCVPAMAMPSLRRITSASISARGITGMPRSAASASSGLPARTALETTTTSAWPTLRESWPIATGTPSERSRATVAPSARSEPVTV